MGAEGLIMSARGATEGATSTIPAVEFPFDPLEYGPPHFFIRDGGVYRYKNGEAILVSNNVERWSMWCHNDED